MVQLIPVSPAIYSRLLTLIDVSRWLLETTALLPRLPLNIRTGSQRKSSKHTSCGRLTPFALTLNISDRKILFLKDVFAIVEILKQTNTGATNTGSISVKRQYNIQGKSARNQSIRQPRNPMLMNQSNELAFNRKAWFAELYFQMVFSQKLLNASITNTIEYMLVPGRHVMRIMIPGSTFLNLYTPLTFCRPLLWFRTGPFAPTHHSYFVGMECTLTSNNMAAPHRLTRSNDMTTPI